MSTEVNSVAGVVERMLDHAAHGRWDALPEVLDEHFEFVEPDSLPYGGTHHGVDGYVALMKEIGSLFELAFEPEGGRALDDRTAVLRMNVDVHRTEHRSVGHASHRRAPRRAMRTRPSQRGVPRRHRSAARDAR